MKVPWVWIRLAMVITVLVALMVIGWTVAPVDPLPIAPRAVPADGPDTLPLTSPPGLATNLDDDETGYQEASSDGGSQRSTAGERRARCHSSSRPMWSSF